MLIKAYVHPLFTRCTLVEAYAPPLYTRYTLFRFHKLNAARYTLNAIRYTNARYTLHARTLNDTRTHAKRYTHAKYVTLHDPGSVCDKIISYQ